MNPALQDRIRRLRLFGPDEVRRLDAIDRFWRVETMVARIADLSDPDAERYFAMMLDDAEPGTEEIVERFIESIRTARRALPS